MAVKRVSASLARTQELPYTTLLNNTVDLIRNPIALAIYTYLQTKNEKWIVRRTDVMERFGIGKHRYTEAMGHLRDLGLVERVVNRNQQGQVIDNQLVIHYQPETSDRMTYQPDTGSIGNPDEQESSQLGHLETNQSFKNESIDTNEPTGSVPDGTGQQDDMLSGSKADVSEQPDTDKPKKQRMRKSETWKQFYAEYPEHRRGGSDATPWKKAKQMRLTENDFIAMLEDLRKRKTSESWRQGFVPGITKYLSEETWKTSVSWPNPSYPPARQSTNVDSPITIPGMRASREQLSPEECEKAHEYLSGMIKGFD